MDSETSLAFGSVIFALVAGYFLFIGFSADVSAVNEAGLAISIAIGSAIVSAVLAIGAAIVSAIRARP